MTLSFEQSRQAFSSHSHISKNNLSAQSDLRVECCSYFRKEMVSLFQTLSALTSLSFLFWKDKYDKNLSVQFRSLFNGVTPKCNERNIVKILVKNLSSSRRTISMYPPGPLSPPLPIGHSFRQLLRPTSRIDTELLYIGSSWSSCLCSSVWRGPHMYITYELIPTSPAVSRMSDSSNLDSFCDEWSVAVQLLLCGVLPPWLVQYCSLHSCVVAVKLLSIRLVSVHVVHPYSSIDTTAAWKKLHFILSIRSDFHMTDSLSIAVHTFVSGVLMSVSVYETLLPR